MSKHFNIHWPLKVCNSSSFRKLLKLCNTLYYILPFVLVIHVNHVHCTLFLLLSVPKLYSEVFQKFNHLRKSIQSMSVIWKKKKRSLFLFFLWQFSLTSHLSGQWTIGAFIEKGVMWASYQYYLKKYFITIDELRWRILCCLGYAKLIAHQLICDLEKSLLVTTHCFFNEKNMCVTFAVWYFSKDMHHRAFGSIWEKWYILKQFYNVEL